MPMQSFTRNYEDNSTEAGFQFTFKRDICGDGYKTSFIQNKTFKKKGLWSDLGKVASIGQEITGISVGNTLQRGTDIDERTIRWNDARLVQAGTVLGEIRH